MPISIQTKEKCVKEINAWARDFDVERKAIVVLLARLSRVDGNQSFKTSINELHKAYQTFGVNGK